MRADRRMLIDTRPNEFPGSCRCVRALWGRRDRSYCVIHILFCVLSYKIRGDKWKSAAGGRVAARMHSHAPAAAVVIKSEWIITLRASLFKVRNLIHTLHDQRTINLVGTACAWIYRFPGSFAPFALGAALDLLPRALSCLNYRSFSSKWYAFSASARWCWLTHRDAMQFASEPCLSGAAQSFLDYIVSVISL